MSALLSLKTRQYTGRSHHCRSAAARHIEARAAVQPTQYRRGAPQDVQFIQKRLLLESMNPLGIKPENFCVVEDPNGAGIVAFAQLQPLPVPNASEFRSLVVLPEHRGKDIGSQLMRHLVSEAASQDIYLTTLRKTTPFYEAAGFKVLQPSDVPWFLWFEAAAGTVVARIAAQDQLVVMLRPATGEAQQTGPSQ